MENEINNLYLYIIRFDGLGEYTDGWVGYHIAGIKQNGKYTRKPTDDDYRFVITSRTELDGEWLYQGEAHIPAATEEAALKWLDSYIKKSLRNGLKPL